MQPHLIDEEATCAFFGNIHRSTLFRGIRKGRYPHPVKVGPNSNRWLLDEVEAALAEMIGGRHE
jgi:predicted DNA-binding transcriptional regulator AlpA